MFQHEEETSLLLSLQGHTEASCQRSRSHNFQGAILFELRLILSAKLVTLRN